MQSRRWRDCPSCRKCSRYCGRKFRVYKTAHKTCDTMNDYAIRRMAGAVHLQDLRCDGEAHAGCQAGCLLYWKEAWLKRTEPDAAAPWRPPADDNRRRAVDLADERRAGPGKPRRTGTLSLPGDGPAQVHDRGSPARQMGSPPLSAGLDEREREAAASSSGTASSPWSTPSPSGGLGIGIPIFAVQRENRRRRRN